LERVQVVFYCLTVLVIEKPFQSVGSIHFHIDRKELGPELLLKDQPRLKRENTSIHFLVEEVLGLLCCTSTFEKCQGLENPFLVQVKLLLNQLHIKGTGV